MVPLFTGSTQVFLNFFDNPCKKKSLFLRCSHDEKKESNRLDCGVISLTMANYKTCFHALMLHRLHIERLKLNLLLSLCINP